jgi:hypothetical protein
VAKGLRNKHYDFTDTSSITIKQICEFCGLNGHDAIQCRRRCVHCLKKFSGHIYNECSELKKQREEDGMTRRAYGQTNSGIEFFLVPAMLRDLTKGFLHENNAAGARRQVALFDVATVRVKISQRARKKQRNLVLQY